MRFRPDLRMLFLQPDSVKISPARSGLEKLQVIPVIMSIWKENTTVVAKDIFT